MASQGDVVYQKAEKALATKPGWFSGTSKEEQRANAAAMFRDSASKYRIEKNFKRAAEVLERSGGIYNELATEIDGKEEKQIETQSYYAESARAYDDASGLYAEIDPQLAAQALEKSITGFQNATNFSRAATKWEALAKLYETIGDLPNANKAYSEAAQMFLGQRSPNLANKSREKNAQLTAQLANGDPEQLHESKELFLTMAKSNIADNLNKFSVKNYLFHYGLVSLSSRDEPSILVDFANFVTVDKQFLTTREYYLLQDILEAIKQQDADMLAHKVNSYANIGPLKPFEEFLIGGIEDKLREAEDDFA